MDAFLDELLVLFSPRVHLLADVKPLVDASYHKRVDELCDKVRSGGGVGVGGAGNSYSLPAALGAFTSSSQQTTTSSTSSTTSSILASSAVSSPGRGGSGNTKEGGLASLSVSVSAAAAATVTAAATGNGTSSPTLPLKVATAGGGGGRGVSRGGTGQSSSTNDELDRTLSLR